MLRIVVTLVATAAALPIPEDTAAVFEDHLDPFFEVPLSYGRQLAEAVVPGTAATQKKPTTLTHMRSRLAAKACPTATEAEKGLLACKAFTIATQIKSAKEETEKKKPTTLTHM